MDVPEWMHFVKKAAECLMVADRAQVVDYLEEHAVHDDIVNLLAMSALGSTDNNRRALAKGMLAQIRENIMIKDGNVLLYNPVLQKYEPEHPLKDLIRRVYNGRKRPRTDLNAGPSGATDVRVRIPLQEFPHEVLGRMDSGVCMIWPALLEQMPEEKPEYMCRRVYLVHGLASLVDAALTSSCRWRVVDVVSSFDVLVQRVAGDPIFLLPGPLPTIDVADTEDSGNDGDTEQLWHGATLSMQLAVKRDRDDILSILDGIPGVSNPERGKVTVSTVANTAPLKIIDI